MDLPLLPIFLGFRAALDIVGYFWYEFRGVDSKGF
jgi:hypothetical protein